MIKLTLFILLISFVGELASKEIRYLGRSPKALFRGDANTAIADDEYTLFYNPAALGKSKMVELYPLNPVIGVTNILDEMDRFKDFPSNDTAAIADRILGLPVYMHLGAYPTIKFGPIGFTMFAATSTSFILRNATHPIAEIDYRLDRGFIFGYAYSFGSGASPIFGKKKGKSGSRTSIGISAKHINRQGLADEFALFGGGSIIKISEGVDSITDLRETFGFSKGDGWGADIGVDWAYTTSISELAVSASIMDIGDTRFSRTEGVKAIPVQEMYMNVGVAWKQDFFIFDYTLALDIHPLNAPIDNMRKLHIGAEVGIPLIRAMAGWSAGYLSYGVALRLWPIQIYAGFYAVELGSNFREEKGSRALIYLSLLDFSFDG